MPINQRQFVDGSSKHVKVGKINDNYQICLGTRNEKSTNKTEQDVFAMFCLCCGHLYGANGCDVWERKCPECQEGEGEDLKF